MKFAIEACHIRLAKESDRDGLIALSKTIWEGHDYLPRILSRWLNEPWFFVCDYQGKIIACIKLSLFPDNVLWFEGLRVHKRFQGMGIGKMMNRFVLSHAIELRKQNPRLSFEFCTYYKNIESLHLTKKIGFRVVKRYYNMEKSGIQSCMEPDLIEEPEPKYFRKLGAYIPLGWQAVHNCDQGREFIRQYGTLFKTPGGVYLLGGVGERCITLLQEPGTSLKDDLPYFQSFYGSRKRISIIIPTCYEASIPLLQKMGFRFWDEEREVVQNMLVSRLKI